METAHTNIQELDAIGYVIPLRTCKLVFAVKGNSLLACGAVDVHALDKFKVPAAKVTGVATVEDLLEGEIRDVNQGASARGVRPGETGREGLAKL